MAERGTDGLSPVWVPDTNLPLVETFAAFCETVTDASGAFDVHITKTSGNPVAANSFTHNGDCWEIHFGVETAHLRDSAGLRSVAHLLSRPHELTSVFQLVGLARDTETSSSLALIERSDQLLDDQAIREITDSIRELQSRLEEAKETGDEAEEERLRDQLERLQDIFASSRGVHGSRLFSDNSIQARQAVSQNIKRARRAIARKAPMLAAHLKQTITVSAFAMYAPTSEIEWDVRSAA